ncbi:hypothetical protein CR513_50976, partial [Mucuna pruriens]
MSTSIYKSLNFGDLEPTRMTIQLANRSVVQPLGVLEDVLFNIFKAMKHPIKDHSLFGIDQIDELVKEHLQLDTSSDEISNFTGDTNYDEESKCSKSAEVRVVETKKSLSVQVATMFTAEYDSAKKERDLMKAEDDSVKEIEAESDMNTHPKAESNSNSEGQKQAEVKSISNNRV